MPVSCTTTAGSCGPSSNDLKVDIANFLERAEKIANSPLAGQDPYFEVEMRRYARTRETGPVRLHAAPIPEDQWLALASWMRPIIFVERDRIHVTKLASEIGRHHALLRADTKSRSSGFMAWKDNSLVYPGDFGASTQQPLAGDAAVWKVPLVPPATPRKGPAPHGERTDYNYADTYWNGHVWHSDTDKAAEYLNADEATKVHYRKCAESRVLSAAVRIIEPMRQWILKVREEGHDL
jgi:hypothetical protein